MATKVFAKALMASEDVQSYVGSCRFYASDVATETYDGAFVNIGDLDLDGVYSATSVDYNVHVATAPATGSLTREDICVIDLAGISEGVIGGNSYKIGDKITDLKLKAGYNGRFRRLMKGDKFWIGLGNFASAPTLKQYCTVANGLTTLTASAASPTADQFNVKVIASKALTIGQSVTTTSTTPVVTYEQLYLVEVM